MKSLIIYLLPLFFTLLLSCEEPTTIDTAQAPSLIIIQGLITNELKQHSIKITRTADFYQSGKTPRVSQAIVTVSDNMNNTIVFDEIESGVYQPDQPFEGVVGNTYDLSVLVEGNSYFASERLLPITTIDSLSFELNEDEAEDVDIDIYSVFLFTKEPQDEDNFYLFKFYENGYELNEQGEDINVTDDTAIDEAIDGIEAPYFYFKGDTARVEMYSLSRESFIFWNDVAALIFSDGGVFSPLPANPRSNISGGALGIFQVSAITAKEIVIQ